MVSPGVEAAGWFLIRLLAGEWCSLPIRLSSMIDDRIVCPQNGAVLNCRKDQVRLHALQAVFPGVPGSRGDGGSYARAFAGAGEGLVDSGQREILASEIREWKFALNLFEETDCADEVIGGVVVKAVDGHHAPDQHLGVE